MTVARPPLKRLVWQSLWMVVPFVVLVGLSWNAWRADADARRMQALEAARAAVERTLTTLDARLGGWQAVPGPDDLLEPPVPRTAAADLAAQARYDAGDYEGVLGSPESVGSAAGLPLRGLAALQLLRRETDPVRLGTLVEVLARSPGYVSPLMWQEAERRFVELALPPPADLTRWREKWNRATTEIHLAELLRTNQDSTTGACWLDWDGGRYLIERAGDSGRWRVHTAAEAAEIASAVVAMESPGLAKGVGLRLAIAGTVMAGPAEAPGLRTVSRPQGWTGEAVLADAVAYQEDARRTRKVLMAVLGIAGLAMAFGVVQSARGTLRALELARRQGEFMAAVSHEMRTPLAAMRLLAENLESGVADRTGQRDEHTRMIRIECSRLGDLVGNVLAFTRDDGEPFLEPFDIKALMFDVDALMRPLAEAGGVAFETRVETFPETPFGDAEALRRAFVNLADNALKHSIPGSNVRCHAAPAGEGKWSLKVTDHGPGVPANERKKIFEPFYRIGDELRRTTPGTGLGLALVKRTATAHGGSITVSDTPGGGACFTLTLPLIPP